MKSRVFLLHNAGVPVFYSTIIGGDQPTSSLTLQSTSGVGTTDSILFKVGSNGARTPLTVLAGPGAAGGTLTIGALSSTQGAIWGSATQTTANYSFGSDGSDTYLNATATSDNIYFAAAGATYLRFRKSQNVFGPTTGNDALIDLGTNALRFATAYTMTCAFGVQTTSALNAVGGVTGYLSALTAAGVSIKLAVLT